MKVLPIFGLSTLMSFVSSGVIAKLYAWPRLRIMSREAALTLLVAPLAQMAAIAAQAAREMGLQ